MLRFATVIPTVLFMLLVCAASASASQQALAACGTTRDATKGANKIFDYVIYGWGKSHSWINEEQFAITCG